MMARPLNRQRGLAGGAGLLVGLAAGSVVAAVMKVDSPFSVAANRFIDATPKWLKTFAIEQFGTSDKLALKVGMVIVLLTAATGLGVLTRHSRLVAPVGAVALAIVGVGAAVTRTGRQGGDWIPVIVAAIVGGLVTYILAPTEPTPGPDESPLTYDRRRFLVGLTTASGGAAFAALATSVIRNRATAEVAAVRATTELPTPVSTVATVSNAAETGSSGPWITPTKDFYRIDTAFTIPNVDALSWTLDVSGMVDNPFTLTYQELLALPMVERTITIACVSNEVGGDLIGNALWQGVPLKDVLARAGVKPGATQMASRSVDGWTCGFPTEFATDGRDALIAVGMNGEPLTSKHGYPARLIVPGIYGYISATKWLREIMLTTLEDFDGYWIPRGWAKIAPVKTQSRIDVPRQGSPVTAGRTAVAGVAWAMHRGIDGVEVQIDNGPWVPTRLAEQPTVDAWRQWVYEWDATPGRHRIRVRATDHDGVVQTNALAAPDPDGATGWHTIEVQVAG